MRITQGMIQNSSLNTMYNNMGNLNNLYNQMNTLKKIQRPSDDPIIAGRSLKLRLNVMEATQHASNVDEATSWMEVTEAALKNTTEIIKDIRTRCVQASNGTLTSEDRQKIVSDMKQLYNQLKQEANVTYAGRYVFSGYKTDQPVFLEKETKLEKDLELKADLKLTGDMTLKKELELSADTIVTEDITLPAGTAVTVDPVDSDRVVVNDDGTVTIKASTSNPPEKLGATVTIPAGTELKANTTIPTGTTLPAGEMLPAGVLNPAVHGYTDGQRIEYEIGVNNTLDVNTLGMPEMMNKLLNNIEGMLDKLSDDSLTDEELNQIFTDMIGEMDNRLKETSEMTAELGSKQNRLEYTQSRLEDDKTNFTELLSNTEDVDLEDVYVEFNTQYMIYQSGLQATSKIIMNTLADFLR
ncbi:flagellar hook-associated protein FlgL [Niameybacter massiliensis]|uniref:flagellar hook-associated protein FlgL n=1 Tax=Niameybacter massiliensis TaxID=1658108 RepID=UPI0006B60BAF|nr:flagellar hook-associated protein FlgL [Niameybacter massiliensis]